MGLQSGLLKVKTLYESKAVSECVTVSEHSSHSRLQTSDVRPGQTIACSLLYELSASHFYVILPTEGPQWWPTGRFSNSNSVRLRTSQTCWILYFNTQEEENI